jgi:hypothetical protein
VSLSTMASRHTAHWVPAPTLANTASVTFKMGNFASSSLEAGGVPRGGLLISCRHSSEENYRDARLLIFATTASGFLSGEEYARY